MEHVVFFPAPDGSPAFRRVAGLEEAVRLVEHLRNVEGVADVSVHPLGAEVPLAFRTWYRVEVPAAEGPTDRAAEAPVVPAQAVAEATPVLEPAVAEPAVVEPAIVEPAVEEPVPAEAVAPAADAAPAGTEGNGHRDTVPSLGFFAT